MIYSMTGYGQTVVDINGFAFQVDIKSLNSRNIDVNIRASHLIRQHEIAIKKLIAEELVRGKIEIYITEETYQRV